MPTAPFVPFPLGFPWRTFDPFLFCVHHDDAYPAGNEAMGPDPSLLRGRQIGMDFEVRDGWRMYHGDVVPGFPRHPHRGFETVTIVRSGFIDHSDSMGATARFGNGDTQWMTAGAGIVHSEMFPLVRRDAGNPTELFQIWINLPRADKMVDPHFAMLWGEKTPRLELEDEAGRAVSITLFAGAWSGAQPQSPPPKSWAARADAHVAIWTLRLAPGAVFALPAVPEGVDRSLYFFDGDTLEIGGAELARGQGARLTHAGTVELCNGEAPTELLLLQGRPIGEPVTQHGPFVMNDVAGIRQAFADYQRTGFGGWPWESDGPVHPREAERFAVHIGGREERPPGSS